MKIYRLSRHLIDTTHLRLIVQGRCIDFGSDYPKERDMAEGTLRVMNKIGDDFYDNKKSVITKEDEKYLKNAIKIGAFEKATKKEIENEHYDITVYIMDEKDRRSLGIAKGMVNEKICGVVLDGEDFPVVGENYTENDEGWMRIIAEEKGFPTEDLPYDVIWKVYAGVVGKAIKEVIEKCKKNETLKEQIIEDLDQAGF